MRYFRVLATCLAVIPAAALTETAPPTEVTTTAPVDVSGYRLCPRCNTLNLPQAEYCMRCGTALTATPEEAGVPVPAAVKSFALTPFVFFGNYDAFGGGIRSRFDRGEWSLTPSYAYNAYLWRGDDSTDRYSHRLGSDVRFYFGVAALRPFLGGALDVDYYYYRYNYYLYYERERHYFKVFAGFGGGLELNYDERGSFFDIRGFAGPAASWYGGPDSNFHMLTYFSFITGNVTYFNRHVGLDTHLAVNAGAGYYTETGVAVEIGPSFAW